MAVNLFYYFAAVETRDFTAIITYGFVFARNSKRDETLRLH